MPLCLRRLAAALMPAIIFSRIAGSAHRALVASLILATASGSRNADRIFALITGSAHRALAALLLFARLAGLPTAALSSAPITGSAHRAFAMALSLSRISGVCVLARDRSPAALIPASIFSCITGSAHRALPASRILAREAGSRRAARHFTLATGSAHRAFAARECALARVRLILQAHERNGPANLSRTPARGFCEGTVRVNYRSNLP
jgi:hypothetical protein